MSGERTEKSGGRRNEGRETRKGGGRGGKEGKKGKKGEKVSPSHSPSPGSNMEFPLGRLVPQPLGHCYSFFFGGGGGGGGGENCMINLNSFFHPHSLFSGLFSPCFSCITPSFRKSFP